MRLRIVSWALRGRALLGLQAGDTLLNRNQIADCPRPLPPAVMETSKVQKSFADGSVGFERTAAHGMSLQRIWKVPS